MRKIKFRAKSISNDFSNGNWIYGTFFKDGDDYYMVEAITGSHIKINPDTVGECVNLPDKNDDEIYEGDILEYMGFDNKIHRGKVEFHNGSFILRMKIGYATFLNKRGSGDTIIGNKFENPELLKGVKI